MSSAFPHYVERLLAEFDGDPGRAAVVSKGAVRTAGELAEATRRAAAGMGRAGLGRGDVVCILTEPNTDATLILQWATNLVGATAAHLRWLSPDGPEDELLAELRRAFSSDSGARMLAVDPANQDRVRPLLATAAATGTDRPVLAVLGDAGPGALELTAGSGEGVTATADLADDDLAVITQIRLAGGLRSGVCWSFGVRNSMVAAAPYLPPLPGASGDAHGRTNLLITTPLIHSDVFAAEDTLVSGGLVVLQAGFEAGPVLRAIAEHRISRLMLGFPQVYALAEHADRPGTELSSLTELFYTGSPGSPQRLREVQEAFGPVLVRVYGTTEAGAITMLLPHEHDDPTAGGTVGRPVDAEVVSIRHPDTGQALPVGEAGEVCVKPRWPSAGYWQQPALTAALVRDGWVRTGDLGHLDADGYLHLGGKLTDLVRVEGQQIHTEAVEKVLSQAPGVAQAAVCRVEDADRVERLYAAVVPEPGVTVDLAQLRRHVADALSTQHVPSLIELRPTMPVTGWGKPDRVRLRAEARVALARPVGLGLAGCALPRFCFTDQVFLHRPFA